MNSANSQDARGLPYMTFKQEGEWDQEIPNLRAMSTDFADKEGGGVKKSQNLVDVIYGSPHISFKVLSLRAAT